MSIGVAQAEEGHFAAALESYESAQEIFGQLQRLRSKNGARLLANIAITKAKVFEDRKEVVAAFSTALEAFTEQKLLESKEGVRLLIEAGKALEELERFAEALDHYKTARDTLERARALGSLMGIEVLEKMSDAQFELDDLEGAESNLVMAVAKKDAKGALDSAEGAALLQKLGDLQVELNGYEEALTSYRSARQILEDRNGLKGFLAACLLANMATLEAASKPAQALEGFEEARKLFLEAEAIDTEEGADLLVNLANQHVKAGEADLALRHLRHAQEVFQTKDLLNSMSGVKLWMNFGLAFMQKEGDSTAPSAFEETRDALGKAWKVLEANAGTETLLAVELNALMAQASIRAGNFEAALADLERGRALIQRHGGRGFQDTEAAAEVFYNLGVCYSEMEDLDQAIESFESAASSLKAQGPLSSSFATEVCGALADAYFEAEDTSKAVETYELACQSEEAYDGDETTLALLLTKRGLALAELDDLEDALKDHEQARSVAEEGDFLQTGLGADILVNMGIAKAKGQLLEEAVADFEVALEILEENEMLETEMGARVLQNLSIAQDGSGILALGTTFVVACARKNWSRRKSSFTTFGPKDAGKGEGRWVIPRLWQEFRDQAQPHLLIPATLISMSLAGTASLRAFLTGRLLDTAINIAGTGTTDAIHALAPIAGFYFAAALYGYFANVVQGILFALARWRMSMQMRRKLFKALMRQEVAFFEKNSSGGLVSRLTNDTDQLQNVLNRAPENLVTNLVRLVVSLVLMAKQHLLLTVISVAPLPLAFFLVKKTGEVVGRYGALQNDALARVNGVASEAITNVRAVQLAGGEETETQEYGKATQSYLEVIQQTLYKETALRFISSLVNDALTDVPLLCLSCLFIARGELTMGQFYTYRTLLWSYRRGFRELSELFTGMARAEAVSKRYFDLTDREPSVRTKPDAIHLPRSAVSGQLELHGVGFRYAGAEEDCWAIRNVSFGVKPGEVVALVGASGAGKSTLLKLCARLADPQEGSVRIDGHDLRDIDLKDVRRCLGVVDQDPALFDRTVVDNVAYGCDFANDKEEAERVRAALGAAQATSFVE
ncbi:unnamed protein product, partial [Durusdinium trenchii]